MNMKKVLLVFLGLALLAQGVKLCERGYDARSARRNSPPVIHPQHREPGSTHEAGPKVMLA